MAALNQDLSVADTDFSDDITPSIRAVPAFVMPKPLHLPDRRTWPGRETGRLQQATARGGASTDIAAAALAALEKLQRGVLLLATDGTVRFANRVARTMLDRKHGFAIVRRRLKFADARVASTVETSMRSGVRSLVLHLTGPDFRHGGYQLVISASDETVPPTGYCIFIHEPFEGRRAIPAKVLTELYGLTAGEARLVNTLYVGRSLNCSAHLLGISKNTAKSALKRVFSKCEISSQAELLQLLSLGPRSL